MELPKIKILEEYDNHLHSKSKEVVFPLSKEDKKMIDDMLLYLKMSQIEELQEKYQLRAGWGLSACQLGVMKRIFVIVEEKENHEFQNYVVINPKILSHSEEQIYVGEGEGCLSVNRDVEGIVPRYARMTVKAQDIMGNSYEIRVREELSIAFQHEIDHLNGILFVDKIDPKNPFKDKDNMREI